jgi:Uma2 family endonuclease
MAAVSATPENLCLRIPSTIGTLDGFRTWATSGMVPEHLRVTYVCGEIYLDMSNEELETHALVKAEIARGLMNLNRDLNGGKFYPDGVLVSNEAAGVSNNPDGTFISWKALDAGRVRLVPREGAQGQFIEIEGTPDLVVEVVSNSSERKDTEQLRKAYHRAGIREYWLVDARGASVDFQMLHWRKTGYVAAPPRADWRRSRVFDRGFRLVRRRDRLGLWEYTLEVRAA